MFDHLSPKEPNRGIRAHVRDHICGVEYAKVERRGDRDGIEKFLYDHFRPECNAVDPGGAPIAVNLP
jgi:hypothetical protein